MRSPIQNLKTEILTHLIFLILSAMVLINVVMIKYSERDLIKARLETAGVFLRLLEMGLSVSPRAGEPGGYDLNSFSLFRKTAGSAMKNGGLSEAILVGRSGRELFRVSRSGDGTKALSSAMEALATGEESISFFGNIWGVFWISHEKAMISSPILSDRRVIGAAAVCVDLKPIYATLRETEKFAVLFIFISAFLMVLFGIYLLSKTVVRPVHRLLRITREFDEKSPPPDIPDESGNEIGQLFRSLNLMLKRLEENKKELKGHIVSLERANAEIRRAQEEIIRSEKLASLGVLATGVAHEIGNPIGIVLGYLEMLRNDDLSEEEKRDYIERIDSEVKRISEIIRQLLDFSRPAEGDRKIVSIHEILTETLELLRPQPMMSALETEIDLRAENEMVNARPGRIKQVLLNILINGAEAVKERREEHIAGRIIITSMNRDGSIIMTFTDNGPGVRDEEIERIFDPFFTTREPGKGTGLGLAVCHRIIEEERGSIRADNDPAGGLKVVIKLPLAAYGMNAGNA